jgi:transposase
VKEGGEVSTLAREHDIQRNVIYYWLEKAGVVGETSTAEEKPLTKSEREELHRLRREKRRLEMERDILKKAAAFFAKEST